MIEYHQKESLGHVLGKIVAIFLLKSQGFRDYEIKTEYPVYLHTNRKRYIDVVGISVAMHKKVAYEIGNLHGGPLDELYFLFDECHNLEKLDIESQNIKIVFEYLIKELRFLNKKIKMLNNEIDTIDPNTLDLKLQNFCNFNLKNPFSVFEEIDFVYYKYKLNDETISRIIEELSILYRYNT